MKPFKAHTTDILFKVIKSTSWILPKWLSILPSLKMDSNDPLAREIEEREREIRTCGLLEGDFTWKAVAIITKLSQGDLDSLHSWLKTRTSPLNYMRERDPDFFEKNFTHQGGIRYLGWVDFNERQTSNPLKVIDIPDTKCSYCFITLEHLPKGVTYLTVYNFLTENVTDSVKNVCAKDFSSYSCLQSLNPFSQRFRVLEHYSKEQNLEQHLRKEANQIITNTWSTSIELLKLMGIAKSKDELTTIADFYRNSEEAYFPQRNSPSESPKRDESSYYLINRFDFVRDIKLSDDPSESFCRVDRDDKILADAFYLKSAPQESMEKGEDFLTTRFSTSQSHLFAGLFLDSYKQFLRIGNTANKGLIDNETKPEDRQEILYKSISELENLQETIDAITDHSSLCPKAYRTKVRNMLCHLTSTVEKLQASISKRQENLHYGLELRNIFFHRRYAYVVGVLVIIQVIIGAVTIYQTSQGHTAKTDSTAPTTRQNH